MPIHGGNLLHVRLGQGIRRTFVCKGWVCQPLTSSNKVQEISGSSWNVPMASRQTLQAQL